MNMNAFSAFDGEKMKSLGISELNDNLKIQSYILAFEVIGRNVLNIIGQADWVW